MKIYQHLHNVARDPKFRRKVGSMAVPHKTYMPPNKKWSIDLAALVTSILFFYIVADYNDLCPGRCV